jgi:hypothetical protein
MKVIAGQDTTSRPELYPKGSVQTAFRTARSKARFAAKVMSPTGLKPACSAETLRLCLKTCGLKMVDQAGFAPAVDLRHRLKRPDPSTGLGALIH